MNKLAIAVPAFLAVLLVMFAGAASSGKQDADVQGALGHSIAIEIYALGLQPGHKYDVSFEFVPENGGDGYGPSDTRNIPVDRNGTFIYKHDWWAVTYGRAGTITAWLREQGTDPWDPPAVNAQGEPLVTTFEVPSDY